MTTLLPVPSKLRDNVPSATTDHKENPPEWNPSMPSRGLGDDIAKVMHATGMATVVKAVTKAVGVKDCGCSKRQAALNKIAPRKGEP